MTPVSTNDLSRAVEAALASQGVLDMHTHLYPPAFGTPVPNASGTIDPSGLMLWGIDELLTCFHARRSSKVRTDTPRVLRFRTADTGDAWTMRLSAEAPVTTRDASGKADCDDISANCHSLLLRHSRRPLVVASAKSRSPSASRRATR